MRRLATMILSLSILLSSSCALAQGGDELYTLWNIPWGTPVDEIPDLLYKETSIIVARPYEDASSCELIDAQKVKFAGIDVDDIMFYCLNDNKTLEAATIAFSGEDLTRIHRANVDSPEEFDIPSLKSFEAVLNACIEKYGKPTAANVYYLISEEKRQFGLSVESEFDENFYYTLKKSMPNYGATDFMVDFNNITVTYECWWNGNDFDKTEYSVFFSNDPKPYEVEVVGTFEVEEAKELVDVDIGF